MSDKNNIRKDYTTFASKPKVPPTNGNDSLTNQTFSTKSKEQQPIKNEYTTENGDHKVLRNIGKTNHSETTSEKEIFASSFAINQKKREEQIENSLHFGGISKQASSNNKVENSFVSQTVKDKNLREQNQIQATQNVVTSKLKELKPAPVFEDKFTERVSKDAATATSEVVQTLTKAFSPEISFAEEKKLRKREKAEAKDNKLLAGDGWFDRNGHLFTYIGLFLFTSVVYFRPYEWVPGMEGFTSIALIFALITLLFYVPSQLATEGTLTIPTTEVKCVLFLVFWAVLTMPISKDFGTAWKEFNEVFVKIAIVFVVMVNTLRTKERLKGLMWLSIGVGVMLSFQALQLYNEGKFEIEGYRVNPDFGGMFGNPNDTALHLVIFMPVAIALGLTSKSFLGKILYFASATLMVSANFVLQSRGGFLGMIVVFGFLVWKLSRNNRLIVISISLAIAFLVLTFAPGNYWLRIASIFIPALDPVGSSTQRKELLELSIQVTLRNPLGIGIGCFPIVGIRNLQTHNAFTQISSELGWLGLIAYVTFLLSPFRKLGAIERQLADSPDNRWMYYLAIGLQASIIGFIVSGFFVSVAYQWFVYFPIAYAVCLRRIYKVQQDAVAKVESNSGSSNWLVRDEFATR